MRYYLIARENDEVLFAKVFYEAWKVLEFVEKEFGSWKQELIGSNLIARKDGRTVDVTCVMGRKVAIWKGRTLP